jgi:hypothetical protein
MVASSEINDVIDLRGHPAVRSSEGSLNISANVSPREVELSVRQELATGQALVHHRRGRRPRGSGPVHRLGDVALLNPTKKE